MTCCLLIETAEAVEHIDAILDVPGVDLAVVAQFDLSTALGVHGQFDSPVFVDAVVAIEQAAAANGTPLGGVAMTADRARRSSPRDTASCSTASMC
jgi:4-hydroxy-2-oxoheptanedioate aldolase